MTTLSDVWLPCKHCDSSSIDFSSISQRAGRLTHLVRLCCLAYIHDDDADENIGEDEMAECYEDDGVDTTSVNPMIVQVGLEMRPTFNLK